MLKQISAVLLAALMALFGFAEGGAIAFPTQAPPPALQSDAASPLIIDVRHGGGGYHGYHGRPAYRHGYYRPGWNNWNHRYYGRRCGYYSYNCRYRYGNYWYPYQWWLPGVGVGIAIGATANYNSKHKNWCANKYRSYNPKTNTYVTKNGVKKKCNSPYN